MRNLSQIEPDYNNQSDKVEILSQNEADANNENNKQDMKSILL